MTFHYATFNELQDEIKILRIAKAKLTKNVGKSCGSDNQLFLLQ